MRTVVTDASGRVATRPDRECRSPMEMVPSTPGCGWRCHRFMSLLESIVCIMKIVALTNRFPAVSFGQTDRNSTSIPRRPHDRMAPA